MSDLISRSALIELIQKDIEKTASFMNTAEKNDGSFEKLYGQLITLINYRSIISDMSTAYNPEKVVEEMEERSKEYNSGVRLHGKPEEMLTHEAIDIVKRGGVE